MSQGIEAGLVLGLFGLELSESRKSVGRKRPGGRLAWPGDW